VVGWDFAIWGVKSLVSSGHLFDWNVYGVQLVIGDCVFVCTGLLACLHAWLLACLCEWLLALWVLCRPLTCLVMVFWQEACFNLIFYVRHTHLH
jgi:hypothetical protein